MTKRGTRQAKIRWQTYQTLDKLTPEQMAMYQLGQIYAFLEKASDKPAYRKALRAFLSSSQASTRQVEVVHREDSGYEQDLWTVITRDREGTNRSWGFYNRDIHWFSWKENEQHTPKPVRKMVQAYFADQATLATNQDIFKFVCNLINQAFWIKNLLGWSSAEGLTPKGFGYK